MLRGGDSESNTRFGGSADYFAIASHGWSTTHLDALCHIFVDGKMFNGYDMREVRSDGAHKNRIMVGADGIVSRGVLLDIPGLRGTDWLELGERVTAADLTAAEEVQRVRVKEGDILLVATGRDAREARLGPGVLPRQGWPGYASTPCRGCTNAVRRCSVATAFPM